MFRQPFQQGYPYFRQDLSYDQRLMIQIGHCQDAFNCGDMVLIRFTVDTLEDMLTPDINDNQFHTWMEEIDSEAELTYQAKLEKYKKEYAQANCPDVLPKPTLEDRNYYKRKFRVILACLQRHGLLLKQRSLGEI